MSNSNVVAIFARSHLHSRDQLNLQANADEYHPQVSLQWTLESLPLGNALLLLLEFQAAAISGGLVCLLAFSTPKLSIYSDRCNRIARRGRSLFQRIGLRNIPSYSIYSATWIASLPPVAQLLGMPLDALFLQILGECKVSLHVTSSQHQIGKQGLNSAINSARIITDPATNCC